ncbi:type II secretion system F family protein [Ferrimonas aestuarii]|uniref:Type II secretion system F family protein n=1 Tax=Ferrimonas aestuarii TaxID=2569539 RepID=A0A4U1BLI1_9GAMM|nr:type II secretion system F family protein [Ferrimonas aestuarii]TKB53943.1 type II secretion system F family protein [Ferrimonas aestuarii]
MALFSYRGYDLSGNEVKGEIDAKDKALASTLLLEQQITAVEIKPVAGEGISFGSKKVNIEDIEFLTSELAMLLANGVRIDRGLGILAKKKGHPKLTALTQSLLESVKRGEPLADALGQFPEHFDELYLNLVRVGEASGTLPTVFDQLAADLKFRRQLNQKVKGALTYPMVILFVCVASVMFIFNFVVPQLSGMFDGNAELPSYTVALLSTSEWMQQYQGFLFAGLAAIAIAIKMSGQNKPQWRLKLEQRIANLPGLRALVVLTERIRFNTAAQMMLRAGISIDQAIGLAAGNVKNREIRQVLLSANDAIKKGHPLTESLSKSVLYPDLYVSLLEVGAESGDLEPVFKEIASRSREEFDTATTRFTALLEPLLILFMSVIVGGVVIVMMLSIMSVNDVGF